MDDRYRDPKLVFEPVTLCIPSTLIWYSSLDRLATMTGSLKDFCIYKLFIGRPFHDFACHLCTRAMLIFSVLLQFDYCLLCILTSGCFTCLFLLKEIFILNFTGVQTPFKKRHEHRVTLTYSSPSVLFLLNFLYSYQFTRFLIHSHLHFNVSIKCFEIMC